MSDETIPVVLFLGVFCVGEAVQGVEYVLEHLGVYIASPEEIEMFVVRNFSRDSLSRQLFQHGFDVNQGVAAAVNKDNGGFDVAGGILGDFGVFARGSDAHGLIDVVVVHLEALVANNLKPMDDTLCTREGVEVGVGSKLLARRDVFGLPSE